MLGHPLRIVPCSLWTHALLTYNGWFGLCATRNPLNSSPGKIPITRRYVNEFGHQEPIDQVFVASTSNSAPIATAISISRWTSPTAAARSPRGCGTPTKRSTNRSTTATTCASRARRSSTKGPCRSSPRSSRKVDPAEVNDADFLPLPAVEVDKLVLRLGEILRGLERSRACERWPSAS